MTVHKGTSRFVIVFLGIAIKLPRIQLRKVISHIFNDIRNKEYGSLWLYIKRPVRARYFPGLKFYLFGGIQSNWNEFRFWVKNKNSFCEPTYFSLLGLVNVQRASPSFQRLNDEEFWFKMAAVEGYDRSDGHHFANKENFNDRDGKIYIVDYSNEETQEVIQKFGDSIRRKFSA